MKIISGKYKGRILNGFNIEGTRPTMDRVKESVFGMIQEYIPNSIILDLYSGTGNLGIEAISNGAIKAYLVDNNKVSINTINKNLEMLNITNAIVLNSDANKALESLIIDNVRLDIILLDPPYNTNELDKSLTKINSNTNILNNNAIIVCETEINIDYTKYTNLNIYKTRTYGSKIVTILKKQ